MESSWKVVLSQLKGPKVCYSTTYKESTNDVEKNWVRQRFELDANVFSREHFEN